jgi:hypothetical protein
MHPQMLANEAEKCRQWAPEYAGRPEEWFLLKLASAYEELARKQLHPFRKR